MRMRFLGPPVSKKTFSTKSTFFRPLRVAGITLRTQSESPVQAAHRLRKWVFNSSNDIEVYIEQAKRTIQLKKPNFEEDFMAGKPVTRKYQIDGSKTLIPISVDEALNANMIISLGLESADNLLGISAGIREFNRLLFKNSDPKNLSYPVSQFAYYHPLNRYDRYTAGLRYFNDIKYFDQHSVEFAMKYLVPRIIDNNSSKLIRFDQVKPLLLCGFSMGARENAMYLNALTFYLKNHFKLNREAIELYLSKIYCLNIGMAVKWDVEPDFNYASLNFLSLNDMGTLKPQNLFNAVYANRSISQLPYSILHRSSLAPTSELLAMIGHGQIPQSYLDDQQSIKLNPLGHYLAHYVRGIEKSPVTKLLEIPRKFLNNDINSDFTLECINTMKESKLYPVHHNPSSEEINALELKWSEYIHEDDYLSKNIQNEDLTKDSQNLKLAPLDLRRRT